MKIITVLLLSCFVLINSETKVEQCKQDNAKNFKQSIEIVNCQKPPCKLKKKTVVKAVFRFTPDRNVKTLKNSVHALLVGIPFPFIGVDETDACRQIYKSDGKTKNGCPLKAGEEYVYKAQFEILELYPTVRLVVHWGLKAQDGQDVMCFEVKARIVN